MLVKSYVQHLLLIPLQPEQSMSWVGSFFLSSFQCTNTYVCVAFRSDHQSLQYVRLQLFANTSFYFLPQIDALWFDGHNLCVPPGSRLDTWTVDSSCNTNALLFHVSCTSPEAPYWLLSGYQDWEVPQLPRLLLIRISLCSLDIRTFAFRRDTLKICGKITLLF